MVMTVMMVTVMVTVCGTDGDKLNDNYNLFDTLCPGTELISDTLFGWGIPLWLLYDIV